MTGSASTLPPSGVTRSGWSGWGARLPPRRAFRARQRPRQGHDAARRAAALTSRRAADYYGSAHALSPMTAPGRRPRVEVWTTRRIRARARRAHGREADAQLRRRGAPSRAGARRALRLDSRREPRQHDPQRGAADARACAGRHLERAAVDRRFLRDGLRRPPACRRQPRRPLRRKKLFLAGLSVFAAARSAPPSPAPSARSSPGGA